MITTARDDRHIFPLVGEGGTIDWRKTMELLRSRGDQYPLLLELKERAGTRATAGSRHARFSTGWNRSL